MSVITCTPIKIVLPGLVRCLTQTPKCDPGEWETTTIIMHRFQFTYQAYKQSKDIRLVLGFQNTVVFCIIDHFRSQISTAGNQQNGHENVEQENL